MSSGVALGKARETGGKPAGSQGGDLRSAEAKRLQRKYVIAYSRIMKTTSYSDLRRNLAATLDRVNSDHEPIVITRDRGKPAAVLMSLEDFASFEETRYLLKSPRNAERLLEAVQALEDGQGSERELGA